MMLSSSGTRHSISQVANVSRTRARPGTHGMSRNTRARVNTGRWTSMVPSTCSMMPSDRMATIAPTRPASRTHPMRHQRTTVNSRSRLRGTPRYEFHSTWVPENRALMRSARCGASHCTSLGTQKPSRSLT